LSSAIASGPPVVNTLVMHTSRLALGAITLGLTLVGCAHNSAADRAKAEAADGSVSMLERWMSGSFGSQAQSEADPEYFDIRLHMAPIWTDRADGPWLYIEQARSDFLDKPYRQRVYRLSKVSDGRYASAVYTLPDPVARFTGACDDPARQAFTGITPDDLKLLDGCAVMLKWMPGQNAFVGGTEGTGCASTREGAKYTASEITFTEGLLTSWDRGFDASGKQVWGAVKGGYQFNKEPAPAAN